MIKTREVQPGTPEAENIDPGYSAFMENMKIMNAVVREMKEIPELPSEVPTDVAGLDRVEFPEAGGIHTYMDGQKYPYKGFPYNEFVERVDLLKKITRTVLSGMYHELKSKPRVQLLTLVPAAWASKSLVRTGIYVFYRILDRFKMKSNRYCDAGRELYRAFSLSVEGEGSKELELRLMLRDAICMIIEFDNAYRYRLQDIIAELDQRAVKEQPTKEITRLLEIMQTRERTQELVDTWTLFKLLIKWYLRFDKPMQRIITNVLANIDIGKVKLTPEDEQFCEKRKDYYFKFMISRPKGQDILKKDVIN